MSVCLSCKKQNLVDRITQQEYEFKGETLVTRQREKFCPACGEVTVDPVDARNVRKTVNDWEARLDGFLISDEVRRIRKKLGLTQLLAAKIFGGGRNAFSRYERGEALQMRSTDNLLRILDSHPELLGEILPQTDCSPQSGTNLETAMSGDLFVSQGVQVNER
ncbi:MAG: type II toxin-antitoxin system MqsA family antitoxin [bacterium]|nr:type II toxin-antitoxin system MqsA family antitoxin [bacterium]